MSRSLSFSVLGACLLLWAGCKSDSTECPSEEQQLRQELAQRDTRIRALEDSLHMSQGNGGGIAAQSSTGSQVKNGEISMYKISNTGVHKVSVAHGHVPGEFPEGSERLLTTHDVESLSQWGLKIIRDEIYARHGMRFSDQDIQEHFDRQAWYHGVASNVDSKLTHVERQNIAFLKNYKFTGGMQ